MGERPLSRLSWWQMREQVCSRGLIATVLLDDSFIGCRKFGQIGCGTARAGKKFTATVGALASKHILRARRAERAFERANACFCGLWWEILVAAFATWAQLKHVLLLGVSDCRPAFELSGSLGRPAQRKLTSALGRHCLCGNGHVHQSVFKLPDWLRIATPRTPIGSSSCPRLVPPPRQRHAFQAARAA